MSPLHVLDLRRVQQRGRSRALAKFWVAGVWNFGERSLALLNTPQQTCAYNLMMNKKNPQIHVTVSSNLNYRAFPA